MRLNELFEARRLIPIVIYAGRFQPFHLGHRQVYDWLTQKFGQDAVHIFTSNKTEPERSPWTFEDKAKMIMATGIPSDRVHMVANPYKAEEIMRVMGITEDQLKNYKVIYAVGQKDMEDDPRFTFKPKKDGSASYLQPYNDRANVSMDQHGLVIAVPTFTFKVLGKPITSATDIRNDLASAKTNKNQLLQDLYGANYKAIAPTVLKVFS